MPNGHGGIPRWGGALLWALFFGLFLMSGLRSGEAWSRWAGAGAAAVFAWRLSWHYWMYPLEEYGGAYASEEGIRAGSFLHRLTTGILAPLLGGVAWWLWP